MLRAMKIRGAPPHTRGHAHNDEMHARPLVQALEDGFTSLEVDVHLIQGKLLVGHTAKDAVQKKLTLEKGYLEPLQERVRENGSVQPGGPEVTLMLDFKGDAAKTYAALQPLLTQYDGMLTHFQDGHIVPGPVRVVLTGNEPAVTAEQDRSVFLDATLHDALAYPESVHAELTPTANDNYRRYFRWNGQGTMPAGEKEKLAHLCQDAHKLGLGVRLWDAPDQPNAWKTFQQQGVDRINTDDLDGFAAWTLRKH